MNCFPPAARLSTREALRHALSRRPNAPASSRNQRRGMSLVEVMVVIAIILTLMSILAFGVMSVFQDSQVETTRLQMGKVAERVDMFMLKRKKPPTSSEGLAAVFTSDDVPTDSWGNNFLYQSPGPKNRPYDIISYGSDGKEGGTGNAADIRYSEFAR